MSLSNKNSSINYNNLSNDENALLMLENKEI